MLTALFPVNHFARWEALPFVPVVAWFRDRPGLTRAVGVAKVIGAVAFAASLSDSPGPAWVT